MDWVLGWDKRPGRACGFMGAEGGGGGVIDVEGSGGLRYDGRPRGGVVGKGGATGAKP